MARALRIQFAGAFYHVACRGNERRPIYRDESDRLAFLELLERSLELHEVRLLCYALMPNHFHLLIQTLRPNLSEFMRHFNISYTSAFNRRHRRSGHLYQGRYHATVVERESYLLEVSRYLHLNPARVKSVRGKGLAEAERTLRGYRWSSYPGYVNLGKRRDIVDYTEILSFFGGDTARGRKRYADFVREGIRAAPKNPFEEVIGQVILGGKEYAERLKERFLAQPEAERERPAARRLAETGTPERALAAAAEALGCEVEELARRGKRTPERGLAMELLHRVCGLSQAEIGKLFGGLDYTSVSMNRKKFRSALEHDKKLRRVWLDSLEKSQNQE